MFRQLKSSHFDADDQDADNSSGSAQSDNNNGQPLFELLEPIRRGHAEVGQEGHSHVDTGLQSHLDWAAGFPPSPAFATGSSAASSVSAAPSAPPVASTVVANTSSVSSAASSISSAASVTSGASSGGSSSTIVSTSGSGLVFNNTYTANCTASYISLHRRRRGPARKSVHHLNSDTIVVTFDEQNSGNNGVALGNSSHGILTNYSTLKTALQSAAPSDVLPSTDPSGGSSQWYLPYSYARMLGLSSTTGSPDLSVTLNTFIAGTSARTSSTGSPTNCPRAAWAASAALAAAAPHDNTSYWGTMDLFRYDSAGNPDYTNGRDGKTTYFSSDGGADAVQRDPVGRPAQQRRAHPFVQQPVQFQRHEEQRGRHRRLDPELGLRLDWVPRNAGPDPDRARRPGGARLDAPRMEQDVLATSGPWEADSPPPPPSAIGAPAPCRSRRRTPTSTA